jgi:hypothetical protein
MRCVHRFSLGTVSKALKTPPIVEGGTLITYRILKKLFILLKTYYLQTARFHTFTLTLSLSLRERELEFIEQSAFDTASTRVYRINSF